MKLCVSLYGETIEELSEKISRAVSKGADLIEVRLDYLREIKHKKLSEALSPFSDKLIITLRPVEEGGRYQGDNEERLNILTELSNALSPKYVDVEFRLVDKSSINNLRALGSQIIVSWHNYTNTPNISELNNIVEGCLTLGDIAKVVPLSKSPEDNLRIQMLYNLHPPSRLVAFCMGEEGRITRILSLFSGAPFTYVSLHGEATAPGQLTLDEARSILSWTSRASGN